ncbi:MAG: S1C family serine protease [Acidimicrobiales bacterium]
MSQPPDDFENHFEDHFDDDTQRPPLLPPEDRIWRHPSEIGALAGTFTSEPTVLEDRWLQRTPSRASAWSAGAVGAILATGVVLVGMHLTAWIGHSTLDASNRAETSSRPPAQPSGILPSDIAQVRDTVAKSLVVVQSTVGGRTAVADGVVIAAGGLVAVPASVVVGASAIQVGAADRQWFAADLVGSDPETGLAVVSIGDNSLQPIKAAAAPLQAHEFVGVESATSGKVRLALGDVGSFGTTSAKKGMYDLLSWIDFQPTTTSKVCGSVLVNGAGEFVGMVTGSAGNSMIEVPATVAEGVATEIARYGEVRNGWLDFSGVTSYMATSPSTITTLGTAVDTGNTAASSQPAPLGIRVETIAKNSTAQAAGLKVGDVIEAVNGHEVTSMNALGTQLYLTLPSSVVRLTVLRGASTKVLEAQVQGAG